MPGRETRMRHGPPQRRSSPTGSDGSGPADRDGVGQPRGIQRRGLAAGVASGATPRLRKSPPVGCAARTRRAGPGPSDALANPERQLRLVPSWRSTAHAAQLDLRSSQPDASSSRPWLAPCSPVPQSSPAVWFGDEPAPSPTAST